MNCEHCKQPIDPNGEYFWGRYGGEWHPLCLHEIELQHCAVIGMWHKDGHLSHEVPKDYVLAKIGLDQGAGI